MSEDSNNNTKCYSEDDEGNLSKTPVLKVWEYGSNMIQSYRAPMDRALGSSSAILSSGVMALTNKVMEMPVVEQYVPWLDQEEQ